MINSINSLGDALASAASALHRVYAARNEYREVCGYVVVSVRLEPSIGVEVTPLASLGERHEILRQTPLEVLELYCKVQRDLKGWDGDFESFPLPPSDEEDMQAYYHYQQFDEAT